MSEEVPFARRRREMIDRAVATFAGDSRFPAGWLEGSLADGSADAYSDIDLHLLVVDSAWDAVWNGRLAVIGEIGEVVASLDIRGIFAVGCLMAGPVKLDVFFERDNTLAAMSRIAVKRLWGAPEVFERMKIGDDLGDEAIKQALAFNVLGLLQGSTWPVRILARGQIETWLFDEILLVETAIVPLMLLETDRRAFHRNMFTRSKLLPAAQREECKQLVERIQQAVRDGDRVAMRDVHIEVSGRIFGLAQKAFDKYGLNFPPKVEEEITAFFKREWPM